MASPVQIISLLYLLAAGQAVTGQQPPCPSAVGEAMTVEGNAPIVTLDFLRLDGTARSAGVVFDSGGGAIILDESLANDLGAQPTGEAIVEDGVRFAPATPPVAKIGSWLIALSTSKAFIHLGKESFDTRERIEGLLPGKALEPYQVVLDYPHARFLIAPADCIKHQGERVPSPFLPSSGHPRIQVSIAGNSHNLLLDTGSRVSLARRDLLESLSAAHPEWPHAIGASGTANMPGDDGTEFLLRVPEMTWGSFRLTNVLFVSRPNGRYNPESFETPGPIAGALGGNVLRNFRVEIDYPHGATYLEQKTVDCGNDTNTAGLVLDVDATNHLVVRAISSTAAPLTRKNIRPGDLILEIDGHREARWKTTAASEALSGRIGETRRLTILRHNKEIRTTVIVAHLL